MLFNSYEFIFGFLPVTIACFFVFGLFSRKWALRWLIAASLFFYAWWRPMNLLIIAPSVLINFALARIIQSLGKGRDQARASRAILIIGILFNVAFLGYFKYKNFFGDVVNDAFGASFVLTQVVLPLGISFITFQKIAFLIDVHAKRIDSFSFQEYCLFVLFFPQLIAGPIVHYREIMPQFRETTCRMNKMNIAVALTLFSFGLFKKVVLADGIAPHVSSIYEDAAEGATIPIFLAWMAAAGFTLQMYFDFSGYSDIALGVARFFGIRFPQNFNSPLKSSSIIDFWLRWHMTLTRFLTAYVYNPLALSLTRRRLAKGKAPLSARNLTLGSFAYLLMVPTLVTMSISGLWHGAGYGFLIWGLLHGVFLTINHAWRLFHQRLIGHRVVSGRFYAFAGFLLTFIAVSTSMVFFRSPNLMVAIGIVKGMVGVNGVAVPEYLPILTIWIVTLMFVAFVCPNTLQIVSRHEPALGVESPAVFGAATSKAFVWESSLGWAILIAIITVIGIFRVGAPSEFLYWQF